MRLNDLTIKRLKVPERGQVSYTDDSLPGFSLRISHGGTKTFVVVHGRLRSRTTIGRYPIISLAQARQRAKEILAEKTLGKGRPKTILFDDAKATFLKECEQHNKARTVNDYTRLLARHFPFGRTRLSEIGPSEIHERLDKLRATKSEQHHAYVVLRAFCNFCVRRHYIERSPMENMEPPAARPSRERVLADHELKAVWNACEGIFGRIVRLCILLGARRSEIAALRWDWIDEEACTITLPAEITKNSRTHTFPYGAMTTAVLADCDKAAEYVFPAQRSRIKGTPATVFNGWGKPKAALDKKCPLPPWTLHDLRRTLASNWAALGIRIEVTEKYINHISGTTGGLVGIYNRHSYQTEMAAAVELYERHLISIIARDQPRAIDGSLNGVTDEDNRLENAQDDGSLLSSAH